MFIRKLLLPTVLLVSTEVSLFLALVLLFTEVFTSVSTIPSSPYSPVTLRTTSTLTSVLVGPLPSSPVWPLTPSIPSEEEWWWPPVKPSSTTVLLTVSNKLLPRKVPSPYSRVLVLTFLEVLLVLVLSLVTTGSKERSTPMPSPLLSENLFKIYLPFFTSSYKKILFLTKTHLLFTSKMFMFILCCIHL